MKVSDVVWVVAGLIALGLGVFEMFQGKTMLGLSGLVIGAVLIATSAPSLLKRG